MTGSAELINREGGQVRGSDELIDQLIQRRDPGSDIDVVDRLTDREVARALRHLGARDLAEVFVVLDAERSAQVFELLEHEVRTELLRELPVEQGIELFAGLDPDDRAWLAHEVPAPLARALIDGLSPRKRAVTQQLMEFAPGTVGRAMSPHVVAVRGDQPVTVALDVIRREGEKAETVYMVPVVDADRKVLGVVSLRRLMISALDVPVMDLMVPAVMMRATQGEERAARAFREARLIAAPVVDEHDRLLGVLTVDDAMRILAEADEEDAARATGSEPLRRSYQATSVLGLMRSRIGWLLVLIIAATLTVNVLDHFEDTLAAVVKLALFVPLLIGTGGNAGAQAATTVVRAMATDEIRRGSETWVVAREALTGLVLGLVLAVVGFLPATLFAGKDIALVVCVSLVAICVLATSVGSLTPMLARRLGIDPAVVSAPFISTVVDATGLIVYFLMAQAILGL